MDLTSSAVQAFFGDLVPDSARQEIIQRCEALQPHYRIDARRLPQPVWARHGYADSGPQAWETLRHDIPRIDPARPYCIYIHIPFCAEKCPFCDCYSFRLANNVSRNVQAYVEILEREIRLWSRLPGLARRPVSTVHFGGGTPLFLGEAAFRRIVLACRDGFNTSPETEWALETTSSELTAGMFDLLASLGFTRLHVGVQSLEDPLRRMLGRREPSEVVLEKLTRALSLGWVTSVDLLFGVPTQTPAGLFSDIRRLAGCGLNGFSMYELQRSRRNRPFTQRHQLAGRDRTRDFLLLQGASYLLDSLGYRKTFFNHFADPADRDLYFTFPERGEDCLAMGTIADGVFNGYHYRHPEYAAYSKGVDETFPGLEGGVRQSRLAGDFAGLETSLLSGSLPEGLFAQVLGPEAAGALFSRWAGSGLISRPNASGTEYKLTASGSWFVGEMMAQTAASAFS